MKHHCVILTVPPLSTTAISVGWYTLLLNGALGLFPKLPLRNPAVRRAEGGTEKQHTHTHKDNFCFLPLYQHHALGTHFPPLSSPMSQAWFQTKVTKGLCSLALLELTPSQWGWEVCRIQAAACWRWRGLGLYSSLPSSCRPQVTRKEAPLHSPEALLWQKTSSL